MAHGPGSILIYGCDWLQMASQVAVATESICWLGQKTKQYDNCSAEIKFLFLIKLLWYPLKCRNVFIGKEGKHDS